MIQDCVVKVTSNFILYPTCYSYAPLCVSILVLSVGLFVLSKNFRSSINRTYFLVHFSAFVWLFGFSILYSLHDINQASVVYKILYTGVIFIPVTFYHFIHRFLAIKKSGFSIFLHYVTGIIFVMLVYLGNGFLIDIQKCYWGYQTKAGPIHNIFLTYFFLVFGYSFFLLRRATRDPRRSAKEVNRIRYVFWSFSIALIASIDWLPVYGIEFYPLGFIFMTFFTLVSMVAILKHKLFDIGIIIRRSFVYSVLISLITILYLIIVLLSERFFKSYFGYASVVNGIVIASVIALTFNPLRSRIQKLIDRYFFQIDPEQLVVENLKLKDAVEAGDRMKAIATLAAGMAHEIKNPLTSIKTFVEYLPQKYDDPVFRDKFSSLVTDEVDRINNIVRQLLEFSKPAEPEIKSISINPILDETLNLMNNNLLGHKIGVARDLGTCPDILADKNQLKQVFLNLFLNSIQSMKTGGRLSVSSELQSDGYVRINVSDTGCGIPKEQLSHLFDPFYTTREEGTGLGLAIVHSIIKKHGGKIEVESEVGRGTTISVFLKSRD